MIELKSVGPPPERYADRMVAAMLRQLAIQHVQSTSPASGSATPVSSCRQATILS
jgi:hypothetical protein